MGSQISSRYREDGDNDSLGERTDEVTPLVKETRTGQEGPEKSVPTSLQGIAEKAKKERSHRFQNLFGMLNVAFISACWTTLNKKSAVGVDRISTQEYELNLQDHIQDLVERLKGNRYRAKMVRRQYIPKEPGKLRPLGIPATEDKLLQKAVAVILEAIYEQEFLPCCYGYRPKVGAKMAVENLSQELATGKYTAIVEADIKGFFDNLVHDQLIEMMTKRLDDRRFVRLIQKWLKAGILEPTGMVIHPLTGTPQGGIVSPILSNIYLHYALDEWFETVVKKHCRGKATLCRFADDFVCAFELLSDAERFYKVLGGRLEKFGLQLAADKTKIIRFDTNGQDGKASFDFLGFEFRWGRVRGKPRLERRTSRKKLRKSITAFTEWIRTHRSLQLREIMRLVNSKLRGYYNYYGIAGNLKSLGQFFWSVRQLLWKWLNRRSQKRSFTVEELAAMQKRYRLLEPFIRVGSPDPYRVVWA
jgi:RNA-directed DNA polymerase